MTIDMKAIEANRRDSERDRVASAVAAFANRFRPQDLDDAFEFDARLHKVVQAIYADASAETNKLLGTALGQLGAQNLRILTTADKQE
jgi:hypothetical protein